KEPLLSTGLFRVRTSNLALITQNVQWLMLMGISFVVSVYLQIVRGFSAIETGLVFTAATVGVLQSALPEALQGEISGLSRSVSNLGSSLGTAIAGTILVSDLASGNRSYGL